MSTTKNQLLEFKNGPIEDVVIIQLRKFDDERGWLAELFRHDELPDSFRPEMSYISFTHPGVCRGPHEHVDQADFFCFLGPSTFELRLWDNRPDRSTYGNMITLRAGLENMLAVLVPKGVVHGYKNVGDEDGMVINCPDRLYMGHGKREPVDEIRHEDDANSPFKM